MLFKTLDRQAWKESVHNPDKMLKELPVEILEATVGNPDYLLQYDTVTSRFKKYLKTKGCPLLPDLTDPEGDIAEALLKIIKAERFNTIIMGRRGVTRIKRWLLGSVSAKLLRNVTDETLFLID